MIPVYNGLRATAGHGQFPSIIESISAEMSTGVSIIQVSFSRLHFWIS